MHVPVYIYIGQEYSESLVKRLDLDLVIVNCLIEADTRQPGSALVKLSSTSTLAVADSCSPGLLYMDDGSCSFSVHIPRSCQVLPHTTGFSGKNIYICAPNAS